MKEVQKGHGEHGDRKGKKLSAECAEGSSESVTLYLSSEISTHAGSITPHLSGENQYKVKYGPSGGWLAYQSRIILI